MIDQSETIIIDSNQIRENEIGVELLNSESNLIRSNVISLNNRAGITVNCTTGDSNSSRCTNAFDSNLIEFNGGELFLWDHS
jgi:parallel beta-helix repeat protein